MHYSRYATDPGQTRWPDPEGLEPPSSGAAPLLDLNQRLPLPGTMLTATPNGSFRIKIPITHSAHAKPSTIKTPT